MEKSRTIIHVRSNCDLSVNYDTLKLTPLTELIIVGVSPVYEADEDQEKLTKKLVSEEFRFKTDIEGMKMFIQELTEALAGMERIENMAVGLNNIIEEAKTKKPAAEDTPDGP